MTERKMLTDYPHLVAEWDDEKNGKTDTAAELDNIAAGSHKKFWWNCSKCGWNWCAQIKSRALLGRGCPKCAGKKVLTLDKEFPDLVLLWDDEKNIYSPDQYTSGMRKKVWWKCYRNHVFECLIFYMVRRQEKGYCLDCRFIDNNRLISSENYPELYKEWDAEKNIGINFDSLSKGSLRKFWWLCDSGHSYQSDVPNKMRGRNCPVCAGKKQLSVVEEFPEIMSMWNDKNDAELFTSGSGYIADWLCDKGHDFSEPISRQVKYKNCAVCADRLFKSFYQDDFSLLDEWDYEKNVNVDPSLLSSGSHQRVWWKCHKGHSWDAVVYAYVRGSCCRKCNANKRVSKSELELLEYISSIYDGEIIGSDQVLIHPYELDILLPEINVAFEFNGTYWHSDEVVQNRSGMSAAEYHQMKVDLCAEKNVELFFIWEHDWNDDCDKVKNFIQSIIS